MRIEDYRAPWLEQVGRVVYWIDRHAFEIIVGVLGGMVISLCVVNW